MSKFSIAAFQYNMSYKLGFEAFLKRFQKRFPSPEFTWTHGDSALRAKKPRHHIVERLCYVIKKNDNVICKIFYDLDFGIRIHVVSSAIKNGGFLLYRRPLRLHAPGNQHGRRRWLQDKPKFAQLGANLAKTIYRSIEDQNPESK